MTLTPRQYANQLRRKLDELQKNNRPFQIAVLSSAAQVAKRAFSDGKNNVGAFFSYNDIEPLYVSDSQSPKKLSHKGKNGQKFFGTTVEVKERKGKKVSVKKTKGKKEHKTTYFSSYKEFRQAVGRESNYVNWQLTGDLMSDFGSLPPPPSKKPPAKLDAKKIAEKISPDEYITKLDRDINVKKYAGLSERYGDFLKVSAKEEKEFFRILENELILFITK